METPTTALTTTTTEPGVGSTITIAHGATITLMSYGTVTAADAPPLGVKPGEVEVLVKACSGSVPASFNPRSFNLIGPQNEKIQADVAATKSQVSAGVVPAGDCIKGSVAFTLAPGQAFTAKALEYSDVGGAAPGQWSLSCASRGIAPRYCAEGF